MNKKDKIKKIVKSIQGCVHAEILLTKTDLPITKDKAEAVCNERWKELAETLYEVFTDVPESSS